MRPDSRRPVRSHKTCPLPHTLESPHQQPSTSCSQYCTTTLGFAVLLGRSYNAGLRESEEGPTRRRITGTGRPAPRHRPLRRRCPLGWATPGEAGRKPPRTVTAPRRRAGEGPRPPRGAVGKGQRCPPRTTAPRPPRTAALLPPRTASANPLPRTAGPIRPPRTPATPARTPGHPPGCCRAPNRARCPMPGRRGAPAHPAARSAQPPDGHTPPWR